MAALTLSACGGEPTCSVEAAVADYTDGVVALTECGNLPAVMLDGAPIEVQPWIAAHDCAIAADATRSPFVLRFRQQGIEGISEYAFVGLANASVWELSLVEKHTGVGGPLPAATRSICASLRDAAECNDDRLVKDVCLGCASPDFLGPCPD